MIEGSDLKIGELLGRPNTIFEVPLYQRSYSWKKEQVQTWWVDIKEMIESGSEYFIGAMVYTEKTGEHRIKILEILDGQQRLATTYMIYHLMRRIHRNLSRNTSSDEADEFEERIPPKVAFTRAGGRYLKLKLNNYDNDFFQDTLKENDPTIAQKSHKNIKNAYDYLKKELGIFYDTNSIDGFNKIDDVLSDSFVLMGIKVDNHINAFKLFEAMNDKGLKLSQNDLIKNYIFSKTNVSEHTALEQSWKTIQEKLKQANDYGFDVFIQYYWNGQYEEIRKNDVYKKFTEKCSSSREIITEIEKLKEHVEYLDMFINPEAYEWGTDRDTEEELVRVIDEIRSLGVTQIHILIIQLLKYHGIENGEDRTKEIILPYFKAIRNFIFKYSTVCKRQANAVLKKLCPLARDVNINSNYSTSAFLDEFADITPSGDEVKKLFYTFKSPSKVSKRILMSIYPAPEGLSYRDNKTQTEHVLPQTLDSEDKWKNYLKERLEITNKTLPIMNRKTLNIFISVLTHSIGNHLLLYSVDNIKAGNKFYTEKFNLYLGSNFNETKKIKDTYAEWNEESINKRAKLILDKLKLKWNLFS